MLYHTFALLTAISAAAAHGGASLKREVDAHKAFAATHKFAHCFKDSTKKIHKDAAVRRADAIQAIRERNNLPIALEKRDIVKALTTSHHSDLKVTADEDPAVLFAQTGSVTLNPEATEGPYFIEGEYLRKDLTEGQAGVPFYVDLQIIDVTTCEPVPNAFVEFWGANATGVYSGVVAKGNGNFEDKANVNKTFLRGVQRTDANGVLCFETIFPGHYAGRTTHVHMITHTGNDIKVFPNGTVSTNAKMSHVGQFFFDESLRSAVEVVPPYNTNKQKKVLNYQDGFMNETATGDTDPFMSYAYVGDDIQDGILGWITVGIDAKAEKKIYPAGHIAEDGGVFLGTHLGPDGLVGGYDPEHDPDWAKTIVSKPFPTDALKKSERRRRAIRESQ